MLSVNEAPNATLPGPVQLVTGGTVRQESAGRVAESTYEVIGDPPVETGADHEKVTVAYPVSAATYFAVTFVGFPGGPMRKNGAEGSDAGLVPAPLVAVTVKV